VYFGLALPDLVLSESWKESFGDLEASNMILESFNIIVISANDGPATRIHSLNSGS
jgi:hypothetical protein